ncbi:MAG: hypothetical protein IT292_04500 [Deltaproteobacteria bacterium]|nr:hypothetical protein [Deltaproteobacteria bacterium]
MRDLKNKKMAIACSLIVTLYFCIVLLLASSGPLRTISGISLDTALYLLIFPSLGGGCYLFRWALRFLDNHSQIIFWLFVLTFIVCFSWLQLFNEDFQGFPGYHTSDAANHLHYRNEFISSNPNAYYRFTAFYALSYWLQAIYAEHSFFAWRDAFYLSLFGCYLCLALMGYGISRKSSLQTQDLISLIITSGATIAISHWVLLPIISYNQIDGFYAHLFSLLPLTIIWAIYSLVDSVYWRYAIFLPLIVFCRFTYGLILPDLFLTLAILSTIDVSVSRHKNYRLLWFPIMLYLAAGVAYKFLAPSMKTAGAVLKTDLNLLSAVLFITSLIALSLVVYLRPANENILNWKRVKRMILFPAVFSLVGVIALSILRFLGYTSNYYPYKYLLLASLLTGMLLCLTIYCQTIYGLATALKSEKISLGYISLSSAIHVTILIALAYLFTPLFVLYQERTTRPAAYRHLTPLTDLEGERAINQILKATNKKFGGYLIEHWPRYAYVNVSFGLRLFYEDYQRATFLQKEGYCIFWEHPLRKRNMDLHGAHNALVKIKRITQEGPYKVFAYTRSEGRPKPRMIAYKCY